MKLSHWTDRLLLSGLVVAIAACSAPPSNSTAPQPSASPSSPPAAAADSGRDAQPVASAPAASPSPAPTVSSSRPKTEFQPDPDNPDLFRDVIPTEPIPATGRLTVRGDLRQADESLLFAQCPSDSAPYAIAASGNYRIQICSAEYDPWQPKYYIGQTHDGTEELKITSTNPDEARQLIFQNGGYVYNLYRDGGQPDMLNAYLEVYTPEGKIYAEALHYIYERQDMPQ
ncbi:hypothetical protein ACQ4M4_08910 [Leptolyngbya sp. AN02str]|uniref:hypothetical protein n=1 Tax=Leptolyngbya sp. AN02str TaxID=3423363 RepID=UPI003D314620